MWVSERECSCTWCWAWGPNSFGGLWKQGTLGVILISDRPQRKGSMDSTQHPSEPLKFPAWSQQIAARWEYGGSVKAHRVPHRVVLQQCSDLRVCKESVEEARRGVETEGDFQTGTHLYWTNTKEEIQAEAAKTRWAPTPQALGLCKEDD